eukprot:1811951-Rhodomonas_salina.4
MIIATARLAQAKHRISTASKRPGQAVAVAGPEARPGNLNTQAQAQGSAVLWVPEVTPVTMGPRARVGCYTPLVKIRATKLQPQGSMMIPARLCVELARRVS